MEGETRSFTAPGAERTSSAAQEVEKWEETSEGGCAQERNGN